MLTTKQEFLSTEDLAKLRKWLSDPGAQLFRRVINSRIHETQIEATRKFSDVRERMDEDGRAQMKKSFTYRDVLAVLDEFSDTNKKPYTVKIIEE